MTALLTQAEENYLKSIFKTCVEGSRPDMGTNELAAALGVKPPTANGMLKKLKEKNLVNYRKYGKIALTPEGTTRAALIIRKHRLTEMYLVVKMGFGPDRVHEIAEQVEHVTGADFFDKMDELLGFPATDPHGARIPDSLGVLRR